ncbi:MAG: glycerol acyltransferase [Chloroflexi bacterium]|nr:glycerol acyltransferase [Chloroflexota bacterium]
MSAPGQSRPQCQALTRSGRRCRLPALPGEQYCHVHLAKYTAPSPPSLEQAVSEPPAAEATAADLAPGTADQASQEELRAELSRLREIVTAQAQSPPDSSLQLFTVDQILDLLQQALARFSPETQTWLMQGLRQLTASEWFDWQTWQGIGYVLQIVVETQLDFLKRRLTGDYEVDAWGYDPEFADIILPVVGFFFHRYWRVEMSGVENIPAEGRVLLVSNHSGVLPLDGAMIAYGVREQHPAHRLVRALVANWFPSLPFFSMLLNKTGQVLAHPDNGRRLLAQDEAVLVFPEGYKGVGKPFKERYQLARFGRGGAVRMALETQAPILPVSVVGAEETYPMLWNAKPIARLLGFPYFPITPTFPWLGLFGVIPLPSKWYIDIGEPIDVSQYDPQFASNPALVSELTDLIRHRVQTQINTRLAQRHSVFFG